MLEVLNYVIYFMWRQKKHYTAYSISVEVWICNMNHRKTEQEKTYVNYEWLGNKKGIERNLHVKVNLMFYIHGYP